MARRSQQPNAAPEGNLASVAVITGLAGWAAFEYGPVIQFGEVRWLPAIAAGVSTIGCLKILTASIKLLARLLDWLSLHKPTNREGSARWGTYKELKKEIGESGPMWGVLADKPNVPLFIDFKSNAYVLGPSGVGKGHTVVVNMILSILASKIVTDFKPELLPTTKRPLEEMGQIVIPLNPFEKYTDLVGETHCLNVVDAVTDCLYRPNGIKKIFSIAGELAMQLHPEPAEDKSDNKLFREGAREIIALTSIIESAYNGYDATLCDVSLQIEDTQDYEDQLRLIVGVDAEGNPHPQGPIPFEQSEWAQYHDQQELEMFLNAFRKKAKKNLKRLNGTSKTFDSFLIGSEVSLAPFSYGQFSKVLGRTTFDFDAIKSEDGPPLNIFLVGDSSELGDTERFFGLMQWFMQLKLKKHPNKHVPVYQINDEAANYSVFGLIELKSWGRSFSIRTIEILQNYWAYKQKHGKHALDVLDSEAEIKLILPGQRSPKTKKAVSEDLGETTIVAASASLNESSEGVNERLDEKGRALVKADEVGRSEYGFLSVREHLPFKQIPISYSEIDPFRTMVDPNPHHPEPFLNKVKLKLKGWEKFQ